MTLQILGLREIPSARRENPKIFTCKTPFWGYHVSFFALTERQRDPGRNHDR